MEKTYWKIHLTNGYVIDDKRADFADIKNKYVCLDEIIDMTRTITVKKFLRKTKEVEDNFKKRNTLYIIPWDQIGYIEEGKYQIDE